MPCSASQNQPQGPALWRWPCTTFPHDEETEKVAWLPEDWPLGSETALMGSHAWAPLLLSLRDDDALTARSLAEGGTVTWEEHVKMLLQGEGFDPPPELSRSFPVNSSYASGGLVNSGVRSGYLQSGKKKSF